MGHFLVRLLRPQCHATEALRYRLGDVALCWQLVVPSLLPRPYSLSFYTALVLLLYYVRHYEPHPVLLSIARTAVRCNRVQTA